MQNLEAKLRQFYREAKMEPVTQTPPANDNISRIIEKIKEDQRQEFRSQLSNHYREKNQ